MATPDIETLKRQVSELQRKVIALQGMIAGGGAIVNHGKAFDVDVSCSLSEIYNKRHNPLTIGTEGLSAKLSLLDQELSLAEIDFADLTEKPTTLAGYGITDSYPNVETITTGYVPYKKTSSGWGQSPVYTDGTKIGIGTTALTYALSVAGSAYLSDTDTVICARGTSGAYLQMYGAGASSGSRAYEMSINSPINGLKINAYPDNYSGSGTNLITMLSSGNIGIGTYSPVGLLQLGPGAFLPTQSTYKELHAGGFGVLFRDDYDCYLTGNCQYVNTTGWINKYSNQKACFIGLEGGLFKFYTGTGTTKDAAMGESVKMTLTNDGKLGIGNTPSEALDVTGNIKASSTLYGQYGVLSLENSDTNAVTDLLTIKKTSTGTPTTGFGSGLKFVLEDNYAYEVETGRIESLWNETNTDYSTMNFYGTNGSSTLIASMIAASGLNTLAVNGRITEQGTYGQIYNYTPGNVTVPQNTTTKIALFSGTGGTNGLASNCTVDKANNKITLTKAGKYHVTGHVHWSSTDMSTTWRYTQIALYYDGSVTGCVGKDVPVQGDSGVKHVFLIDFYLSSDANKDIDIRVTEDRDYGTSTVAISSACLSVKYAGE